MLDGSFRNHRVRGRQPQDGRRSESVIGAYGP